jgi:hypothetical protein
MYERTAMDRLPGNEVTQPITARSLCLSTCVCMYMRILYDKVYVYVCAHESMIQEPWLVFMGSRLFFGLTLNMT